MKKRIIKIIDFKTALRIFSKRKETYINKKMIEYVNKIISEVKKKGDFALIKFMKKIDKVDLDIDKIIVKKSDIEKAYEKISDEQIEALKFMKERIEKFEKKILENIRFKYIDSEYGLEVKYTYKPIESIGCYIPSGKVAYPSTVFMTVIPAKIAGVPRIALCSPPKLNNEINPLILVSADICGVNEIYRIGGAQAIAALAYGTQTIKPVNKIIGPGNIYVTIAKILVSKNVSIDLPAGPSEIVILADELANPKYIALDLISQAEHDFNSISLLVTTSKLLAKKVLFEIESIIPSIDNFEIVKRSISKSYIIVCKNIGEAILFINNFAPEHLEIILEKPEEVIEHIVNAGIILVGENTPVSLTDYCVGTNHVLPTGEYGKTYSGLSVLDYIKRFYIVKCSKESIKKFKYFAKILAESEKLKNHYLAIEGRLK